MSKLLCIYCGEPMKIDEVGHGDVEYECNCDGYLKEVKLKREISLLEYQARTKRIELDKHKNSGVYGRSIRELEGKIRELNNKYYN